MVHLLPELLRLQRQSRMLAGKDQPEPVVVHPGRRGIVQASRPGGLDVVPEGWFALLTNESPRIDSGGPISACRSSGELAGGTNAAALADIA